MWIVLREDLAIIRLVATSAHAFISNAFISNAFISNAFMGKSRLDSPWPGAIYAPWCCVAFGARSNGQEATAMTADQRQWLYLSA